MVIASGEFTGGWRNGNASVLHAEVRGSTPRLSIVSHVLGGTLSGAGAVVVAEGYRRLAVNQSTRVRVPPAALCSW